MLRKNTVYINTSCMKAEETTEVKWTITRRACGYTKYSICYKFLIMTSIVYSYNYTEL